MEIPGQKPSMALEECLSGLVQYCVLMDSHELEEKVAFTLASLEASSARLEPAEGTESSSLAASNCFMHAVAEAMFLYNYRVEELRVIKEQEVT